MPLFSADAKIFQKNNNTKSWKKHPQKLLRKTQIHFFFLTAWAAQTAQTEEFMFQNMAYRPTVYRTGAAASLAVIGFVRHMVFFASLEISTCVSIGAILKKLITKQIAALKWRILSRTSSEESGKNEKTNPTGLQVHLEDMFWV